MRIVLLDAATIGRDISLEPIAKLVDRPEDFKVYDLTLPSETNERIAGFDVVIANKVSIRKENIDSTPSVKLICVAATGTNNIDVDYAISKDIIVKNVADYSTESVSQVTLMHILNLVGRGIYFDKYVKSGEYSKKGSFSDVSTPFYQLKGKKLGIIALGNIGKRVAELATAFGMDISYYSTSGTSHCKDYPSISLEELLSESDIVSIHAPLNDKTNNLITYSELSLMKKTAYIVNVGRGGIINETDLVKALNEGIIAGAAIDVFTKEPIPLDHSYIKDLKDSSKLIMSPHVAWSSIEARIVLVNKIAENINTL